MKAVSSAAVNSAMISDGRIMLESHKCDSARIQLVKSLDDDRPPRSTKRDTLAHLLLRPPGELHSAGDPR